ncbi:MAG: patatin-like phospholipase family protein [Kiritimatiellae bacterium]|nr:patatin-like phospholipase family protein [Kiritimatiellia bacterium]
MKKLGLALGGGGAKGLAHIPMLEVLDELGIRPHRIAGTSIGAVMGALYASGIGGARIRDGVRRMVISKGDSFREMLKKKDALKWFGFFDWEFGRGGVFKGDKFIEFLFDAMHVATFEQLQIPLRIVATDFWSSEQVILERGDLLPAVKASMGLPGVFTPVTIGERVLIDGGGVNPVPHDILDDCDLVVAIDVMGTLRRDKHNIPNVFRAVLGTFDIMQNSIVTEKLKHSPPDIYIRPDITGVELLEFFKAEEIYEQAAPAAEQLREALVGALGQDPISTQTHSAE